MLKSRFQHGDGNGKCASGFAEAATFAILKTVARKGVMQYWSPPFINLRLFHKIDVRALVDQDIGDGEVSSL